MLASHFLMGKLFQEDSTVMQFLNKLAQLLLLNTLMLISIVSIVAVGASATAAYDILWRDAGLEESTWRAYWKVFKSNFRQSTIIWIIILFSGILLIYSVLFALQNPHPVRNVIVALLLIALALWAMTASWIFPLQSRFQNTIPGTFCSAVLFAIGYLPKSLTMALLFGWVCGF